MHPSSNKIHKRSVSRRPAIVDRISELPEGILVNIVSLLTIGEAARTSILSHRWKKLWTFSTGSLDFDGKNVLEEIIFFQKFELLKPERVKFVSWVNQILNAHTGATINELRVQFDLDLSCGLDIDSWINFALQKRVRRLELFFKRVAIHWDDCYPFPEQCLGNSNINFLTSLKLQFVGVTQEILEYLLSNCPNLEFVCISNSPCLLGLKIFPASCPKLEYLEIVHCHHLKFLEISAITLTSLTYSGPRIELCLKNVPNLAALSFGGFYADNIIRDKNFSRLSISLSQIAKLKLDLAADMYGYFTRFPNFKNLEQLELIVKTSDHRSLLSCTSLLRACLMLYRFSIQVTQWEVAQEDSKSFMFLYGKRPCHLAIPIVHVAYHFSTVPRVIVLFELMEWVDEPAEVRERVEKSIRLKCLKVVEFRWFRGSTTDVELATYLLTNAPYLEKIQVDTRHPYHVGTPFEVMDKENVTAKERVRQLATSLSPHAELQLRQWSTSGFSNARYQVEGNKMKRGCLIKVNALPDLTLMAVLVEHMEGQRDLVTTKTIWHLSDAAIKNQEDIEESSRAELWKEELIEEIEQKVGGLRELEETTKKDEENWMSIMHQASETFAKKGKKKKYNAEPTEDDEAVALQ
ncbi:hypothetical protein LguiA_028256 [Lonicera macranthoides]